MTPDLHQTANTIDALLARCDRYLATGSLTEAALSKRLFKGDGGRIRLLRGGGDVGVRKLPEVIAALAALEAQLDSVSS